MSMKLFLPVLASCCSAAVSLATAQPAPAAAKSIALAFEEKQVLDLEVRAALAFPEKQMRVICGADAGNKGNKGNAREWAVRFAERSFAILSDSIKPEKAGNPFLSELAKAYYGRSRIYYEAGRRPMRDKELNGRLFGNDQRIEGVMRAARHSLGAFPDRQAVSREARQKIAALIAPENPASACK